MPSRIIREGWVESEAMSALSAEAERFFLRLCLRADDFGRYHANPQLLRSNLYPLAPKLSLPAVSRWTGDCQKAGLLRIYEVEGKRCLEILKFNQRTRAKNSKFPAPDGQQITFVGQLTDTRQSNDGHMRTDSESESDAKSEAETVAALPPSLPFSSEAFRSAWNDFTQHRKEIHKPLKPTSTKGILAKLGAMGERQAIIAIRHTIAQGWQGIREPEIQDKARYQRMVPAQSHQAAIPEPPDWNFTLNTAYPDSNFSAGGAYEAKHWSDLPREWQERLATKEP